MTFTFRHRQELDHFEKETKQMAVAKKCEGGCDSHEGIVKALRVIHADGTDWGWFSYCQTAQEENRERGFLMFDQTPCSGKDFDHD